MLRVVLSPCAWFLACGDAAVAATAGHLGLAFCSSKLRAWAPLPRKGRSGDRRRLQTPRRGAASPTGSKRRPAPSAEDFRSYYALALNFINQTLTGVRWLCPYKWQAAYAQRTAAGETVLLYRRAPLLRAHPRRTARGSCVYSPAERTIFKLPLAPYLYQSRGRP